MTESGPNSSGRAVIFSNRDFASARRDSLYAVRAIEQLRPALNAAKLRCSYDEQGNCMALTPCFGDYRAEYQDDCLAETGQRARCSPIFVEYREAG